MNTPSHLIINAALRKYTATRGLNIPRGAFLLGAVMPDMPLWLLWFSYYVYFRHISGDTSVPIWGEMFDRLYFTDPVWIASHNLLHSPTLVLAVVALLWRARHHPRGRWWFWFMVGCLAHTAIDIPLHVDDGPLLFFPFEWSIRFQSPVSYWDPRYYGREFTLFELLLDLALLGYLAAPWFARRVERWRRV